MSDSNYCHNHPNAPSIAPCQVCAVELCGMCGNYIDDLIFCEKCVEVYENEKYVAAQTEMLERPKSDIFLDALAEEELFTANKKKETNKLIPALLIGICLCVVAVQLYLYSSPRQVEQDPAAVARDQAIGSLVECMIVFREIGVTLASGRTPDDSLICSDSFQPNRVRSEGETIRVSHPNPRYYGYEEISVSGADPEPRLIQLEQ